MATSTAQRTGIWIITIAMIAGTVVGFIVMILGSQDQAKQQKVLQDYNAAYADYQKKVEAQTAKLSKEYYSTFKKYADTPAKFNAKSVKKLTTKDIKVGSGAKVTSKSELAVYYIGWAPDGKVFDQSIDGKSLKAPFDPMTGVTGFKNGVVGMRIGGVRVITVPSGQAYGEEGQTDPTTGEVVIKPNTPLKFLVMAIPKPEEIKEPTATQEVIDAYAAQYQQ